MDAVIKDLETRMQVAADLLSREFAGVRTGRASTGLLDAVRVEAYGTVQPISQVATISAAPWHRVGGRFRQSMADFASPKPPTNRSSHWVRNSQGVAGIHAQSVRG